MHTGYNTTHKSMTVKQHVLLTYLQ